MQANHTLDDAIMLLITRVGPRLSRLETTALAGLREPLTHRQYRIMHQIATGRTYVTALSEVGQTTVAAMSASVETLVRRGLVTRGSRPGDRRVSTLGLTPRGEAMLADADASVRELARSLAESLDWDAKTSNGFASMVDDLASLLRAHPRVMET